MSKIEWKDEAWVDINLVKPNKWNYNEQTDFIFDKLLESIRKYGFSVPLTVRNGNENGNFDYYEILGGEHRWRAAKELGMKKVPVKNVGTMSDADAKKYMIIENETRGRPNQDMLTTLLSQLNRDGVDLAILPFDDDERMAMITQGDYNWSEMENMLGDAEEEEEPEDEIEDYVPQKLEFHLMKVLGFSSMGEETEGAICRRLLKLMLAKNISEETPWEIVERLMDEYYQSTGLEEITDAELYVELGCNEEGYLLDEILEDKINEDDMEDDSSDSDDAVSDDATDLGDDESED